MHLIDIVLVDRCYIGHTFIMEPAFHVLIVAPLFKLKVAGALWQL